MDISEAGRGDEASSTHTWGWAGAGGGTRGAAPACRDGVGFGAKRLEGPPVTERPG
jgi:hypothetical protein